MRKSLTTALLISALAVSGVHAGGFYFGASVGQATLEASALNGRFDVDDTGYKGFLGYELMRYVAIELGYTDLGNLDRNVSGTAVEAEGDVVGAFAVGILPITPELKLQGKAGVGHWDSVVRTDDGMTTEILDEDGNDFAYGFGLTWNVTRRVALRGEWETYDFGDTQDVKFGSAGVLIDFTR